MTIKDRLHLSLEILTETVGALIEELGVDKKGIGLIPIYGEGDEEDNWEALVHFLRGLPGNTVATVSNLVGILRKRLQSRLSLMRSPNFQVDKRGLKNLYGRLSRSECMALALCMVFLVEQEIARQKAAWIGRPQGIRMFEHLNTWNHEEAYHYCLAALLHHDIRFQKNPAWLLPILANQFYQQTVIPWMERGLYEK